MRVCLWNERRFAYTTFCSTSLHTIEFYVFVSERPLMCVYVCVLYVNHFKRATKPYIPVLQLFECEIHHCVIQELGFVILRRN